MVRMSNSHGRRWWGTSRTSEPNSAVKAVDLCPVGTGLMSRRTDTLFMRASKEDRSLHISSIYLKVIYLWWRYSIDQRPRTQANSTFVDMSESTTHGYIQPASQPARKCKCKGRARAGPAPFLHSQGARWYVWYHTCPKCYKCTTPGGVGKKPC